MPDILIRGMEMPQNCLECTLCAFDGCGSDYCPFTGIEALSIGRQVNCPLIELPPHGDLIDRDEAIAVLKGLGDRKYRREKGTICEAEKMLQSSVYTPTIVPAERRAG